MKKVDRRRKKLTAVQRAASRLGKSSYEKRLGTEGYEAIRDRCIKNTKRFRFKKRRGKRLPAGDLVLDKPIAAPAVAASSIAKDAPIPEQPRVVSMPLPVVEEKPRAEEETANLSGPLTPEDFARLQKECIEEQHRRNLEEMERHFSRS